MPTDSTMQYSHDKKRLVVSAQALQMLFLSVGTLAIVLSLFLGFIWLLSGAQILQHISGILMLLGMFFVILWGFLIIVRPVAVFGFALSRLFSWAYILFRRIPRNKPAKRIILLGGAYPALYSLYGDPDYDIDLFLLVRLLEKKGGDISIWLCKTKEDVIRALTAPGVEEVYFLGHGSDHSFQLGPNQRFYYCELADVDLPTNLHMYLLHCGGKGGRTACDYVGNSIAECVRIGESGVTGLETARWIIDRIAEYADHKTVARVVYSFLFWLEFLFVGLGAFLAFRLFSLFVICFPIAKILNCAVLELLH